MDAAEEVRASHILLKHIGSRNPNDSHRNKPVTRTKEQAIAGIECKIFLLLVTVLANRDKGIDKIS
jgi:hypothetical protein